MRATQEVIFAARRSLATRGIRPETLSRKLLAYGLLLHALNWLAQHKTSAATALLGLLIKPHPSLSEDRMSPQVVWLQPAGPGGFFLAPLPMLAIGDGEIQQVDVRMAAKFLLKTAQVNPAKAYTKRVIQQRFAADYPHSGPITDDIFQAALDELVRDKYVFAEGDSFRLYNQSTHILAIASLLSDKIGEKESFSELMTAFAQVFTGLRLKVDVYLINEVSREMRIIAGDVKKSKYEEWGEERAGGVFQILRKDAGRETKSFRVHDIKTATGKNSHGEIFQEDINKYIKEFKNPAEVLFVTAPIVDSKGQHHGALAFKIHGWAKEGPNDALYSRNLREENGDWTVVDNGLRGLCLTLATHFSRVTTEKQSPPSEKGLSVKELWDKEPKPDASPALRRIDNTSGAHPRFGIPRPGEEGYDAWVSRNELAMSGFYDRFSKLFAHICRLSRAYQVSVIDGVDRVLGLVAERWPEEKVGVVDAGTGSAYFLERLMKEARVRAIDLKATAIDISYTAISIARSVCQELIEMEKVLISRGNMAKMTRSLDDIDAIGPGSQKVVCLNYVLQYIPIDEVLDQAHTVLADDGLLLITNFKPKKTMRWHEFWTNWRASWNYGKANRFGHGRWYEIFRYIFLFLRHPIGIINFSRGIDRDVRQGIIPENPDSEAVVAVLKKHGFRPIGDINNESHYGAALQLVAEKIPGLNR
ncbi:hypothetical protein COT42_02180 [Candidatus Saganbacteria bacterium CG08_land_8_20_14_0_20_45_16]|uniref:Methyltransferase domain-containing protein n=1 Tax=Candidatus Saganbacteria bacterium CG08_land_8_20_14_0_20_45_16 TaxID=2014293 RepID=A0A2H0Y2M4_UNCSA|nr:MAG: hypothetical protein COT42_02180 [Candidatus Saganbacteria bacterium CG08_land_8_20_14_0_20_45_16]